MDGQAPEASVLPEGRDSLIGVSSPVVAAGHLASVVDLLDDWPLVGDLRGVDWEEGVAG